MIESSSDVPEAPTFRPTSEEWRDPLAYISQIVRRQAEAVGMAKVVPPSSWAPVFQLEPRRVRFPCQLLMVHHLYNRESSAAEKQFWERYNAWRGATGGKLRKQPTFAGQEIDIYRLYRVVSKRGGYQKVTDDKAWRDVVSALQVSKP
jgi:[histone H3]-trimethyl-L-lysine4 demethylase